MKKFTKIMARVLPIVLVGLIVVSNVFGIKPLDSAPSGSTPGGIKNTVNNVWGTVATVVQVLAIAAVVLAGIRYMLASANDKADIKKQMVILVIGAVLVFGATTILKLISNATTDIIKAS